MDNQRKAICFLLAILLPIGSIFSGVAIGRALTIMPIAASWPYHPIPIAMAEELQPSEIYILSETETETETPEETTTVAETTTEEATEESTECLGPGYATEPETTEPPTPQYETYISDEERLMIAKMVHAEATGEPFDGKRLVVDVILNRVASSKFPNTVYGVLTERGQFTPMRNGAYDRAVPDDEDWVAVDTELYGRMDYGVLYFNAGRRCANGKGGWKFGHHWFGY